MVAALKETLTGMLAPYLVQVETMFSEELASALPHVNQLVRHVSKFRGKMLRPMLVLLSGLAAQDPPGGILGEKHIVMGTVVEMVHMATLVHDDVLDEAEMRRRGATINHLHGNEAAVLLGDYLVSHAFHLCSSLESQEGSRLVGRTTNIVCEGELTQNFYRRKWDLSESTYFNIIYRKTAVLTETCCRLGALASTDNPETIQALADFGRYLGLAFQITDDVLDISGRQSAVGKTLGTDIEKGKLTLPMIHFLKTAAASHRELLIQLLESNAPDRVEHVRNLLLPSESMRYSQTTAERLVEQAADSIAALPPGEARDMLRQMARFVVERDR